MKLWRSSFIGALDFFARAATILLVMKFAALFGGADGLAAFGLFQNLIALLLLLGGGIFSNGVLRYTAQWKKNPERLIKIWLTTFSLSLVIAGTIVAVLLLLPLSQIQTLLGPNISRSVYVLTLLFLFPGSLQVLFFSIANGLQDPKLLLKTRLVATASSIAIFLLILFTLGLTPSFISLTLGPTLAALWTLFSFHRHGIIPFSALKFQIDRQFLKSILKYGSIGALAATALPLALFVSRNLVLNSFGEDALGNWEGAFRIGDQYLALITSIISIYFLPRFARAKKRLRREVLNAILLSAGMAVTGALMIFVFREHIVNLLLNKDFALSKDLLGIQLATSVVKIVSWVFAFVMVMKGQHLLYAISELLASSVLVTLVYFASRQSIYAVNYSYLITYILYLVFCSGVFYISHIRDKKEGVF